MWTDYKIIPLLVRCGGNRPRKARGVVCLGFFNPTMHCPAHAQGHFRGSGEGTYCKNPICHVTFASTPAEKRRLPRWTVYFLVQMQFTVLYDHRSESDFVFLLCRNLSYLKCDSRICHREAHPNLVKRGRPGTAAHAWNHFCFLSSRDAVWLISTQNPPCVALHNVWFDSFVAWLLKSNVACDLSLWRCWCV